MAGPKLNPTLFDKLICQSRVPGLTDEVDVETAEITRSSMRFYTVPNLERFNESALRATIRREVAWLLNTTNLGAVVDLEPYPQVKTSVLNYGVPDLTGRSASHWAIEERALDIRRAIIAFEPRLDADHLSVEARTVVERDNALTYVIMGNIHSALSAMPVQLLTDVEADTGAVTLRD
jgi:type VI secretion system protein ImpF